MATKSILKDVKITKTAEANNFINALTNSESVKSNQKQIYTKAHKLIQNPDEIKKIFSDLFKK